MRNLREGPAPVPERTSAPGEEAAPARRLGGDRDEGGGLVQAPLRQRRTHDGPDGQARGEGGLQGVVDVRVPLPGAGRGLIGLVELVSPHPGGVDEELLGVVDLGAVVVFVVFDLNLAAAVATLPAVTLFLNIAFPS